MGLVEVSGRVVLHLVVAAKADSCREELGAASGTKRATSCVLIS